MLTRMSISAPYRLLAARARLSSIASTTRPGSIIFSRATASAVCNSSSWLADVIAMVSVLLRTAIGFDLVKIVFVNGTCRLTLSQHLADQLVGQHQLGVTQPVEVEPDGDLFDIDQHLVTLDAGQHSLEPLAPVDHLRGLKLGLVALEHLEILEPGQRPVNTGARHL